MPKKILLVDDDPDILELLSATLANELGCEVITTVHPSEVIALVREHEPDLIVCDIDMDERSGGQVATDLAGDDKGREIPLAFLSSHVDPASVEENGTVEGVWMMSKAAPRAELVDRLRSILEAG